MGGKFADGEHPMDRTEGNLNNIRSDIGGSRAPSRRLAKRRLWITQDVTYVTSTS